MKKSLSLSPDALKLCACALMTFDHTAAVFFPQNLLLRIPGRPAFVIFAFLLAQGAMRTENFRRYALRLFWFGILSEAPFDFALHGGVNPSFQNVYPTLLTGLLLIGALSRTCGLFQRALLLFGAMAANALLHGDYGPLGVCLIWRFWEGARRGESPVGPVFEFILLTLGASALDGFWYGDFWPKLSAGAVGFASAAALPLLRRCSFGRKKKTPAAAFRRYAFYAYYPFHLTILAVLSRGIFKV